MIKLKNILHEQIGNLDYSMYTKLELLNFNNNTFKNAFNVAQKKIQAAIAQANAGKTQYQLQTQMGPITPPWPNKVVLTATAKEITVPERIGTTNQTNPVPALKWSFQCNGEPMAPSNKVTPNVDTDTSRIYGRGISDNDITAFQKTDQKGGETINHKSGMNKIDSMVGTSAGLDKYFQNFCGKFSTLLRPSHYPIVKSIAGEFPGGGTPRAKQWRAVNSAISSMVRSDEYYNDVLKAIQDSAQTELVNKFKAVNAKNIATRLKAYGVTSQGQK